LDKILTQEEINALLKSARETAAGAGDARPARKASPFFYGKASYISKQQIRDIAQLHEAFTYNAKTHLSAYLQGQVEMNPMSVDEVPYSEFMQSLPAETFIFTFQLEPPNAIGIVSLDFPIAFALIDLMLGGNGQASVPSRPATEIEQRLIQNVLELIVCESLRDAWREVVDVHFSFRQAHRLAELTRLILPHEKMLFLSFELRIGEIFSTLTMAFPGAVSSLLLRRLGKRNELTHSFSPESRSEFGERLKNAVFPVEMLLPPTRIRGRDLLELKPGQTLQVGHPVTRPALLRVAGKLMFGGYPVRKGRQRGGLIQEKYAVAIPSEGVTE
jgi:flagellar motor switch protein FliM